MEVSVPSEITLSDFGNKGPFDLRVEMATIQSMYTYELWRQVNTIFHIPRRACAAKLILLCVANVCMEFRPESGIQNQ